VLDFLDKLGASYGPCGADLLRDGISALQVAAFAVNDQLKERFVNPGHVRPWSTLGV
jgi:hypothetical protein